MVAIGFALFVLAWCFVLFAMMRGYDTNRWTPWKFWPIGERVCAVGYFVFIVVGVLLMFAGVVVKLWMTMP